MEMSITPLLDGLLLLGFFILKALFLYVLLKILAKDEADFGLLRMGSVTLGFAVANFFAGRYMLALPIVGTILVLGMIPLIHRVMCVPWMQAVPVAVFLVLFSMTTDFYAPKLSFKLWPEGPTFMDYLTGAKPSDSEQTPQEEGAEEVAVTPETIATEKAKKEIETMKKSFASGEKPYASRKALMDSMDENEMTVYRQEMTRLLKEQQLATDRYSLAALQGVDQSDVSVLVALMVQNRQTRIPKQTQMLTVAELLRSIQTRLAGGALDDTGGNYLDSLAKRLVADDRKVSIASVRTMLQRSKGNDRMAGTVLAALLQAESGLPAALMFAADETGATSDGIQRVPVPVNLGIVRVPLSSGEWGEWMAAAQMLQVKGFLTSGSKTVILLDSGTILNNSEKWQLRYNGYVYGFRIDEVWRGMVYLSAIERNKAK